MIKVLLFKNNNIVKRIEIHDHANYDKYGKDIVCSAVSSIVTTTINAIIRFDKEYIRYDNTQDLFNIIININNDITTNLIENMICMLKEIEETYPMNIKIKEENL